MTDSYGAVEELRDSLRAFLVDECSSEKLRKMFADPAAAKVFNQQLAALDRGGRARSAWRHGDGPDRTCDALRRAWPLPGTHPDTADATGDRCPDTIGG